MPHCSVLQRFTLHHRADVCSLLQTLEDLWSLLAVPLILPLCLDSSAHLFHITSPSSLFSLSLCISYPADLPQTTVPQFLLRSLRKCTTLYNQLKRFAVCHHAELSWGLLVTRLCSLSLSCTVQQSKVQPGNERGASCLSYTTPGGYNDWVANKRISKCLRIRNAVF